MRCEKPNYKMTNIVFSQTDIKMSDKFLWVIKGKRYK
jgi:hypothetical protein